MSKQVSDQIVFACDLTALNAQQRELYAQVRERMQESVEEIKEVADGYAFRHSAATSALLLLAEFIGLERRCCPFLDFALEVRSQGGAAWLTLSGPEGVKEFLRMELGIAGSLS